eukprot:2918712-Prymnesium_polylepis.1
MDSETARERGGKGEGPASTTRLELLDPLLEDWREKPRRSEFSAAGAADADALRGGRSLHSRRSRKVA